MKTALKLFFYIAIVLGSVIAVFGQEYEEKLSIPQSEQVTNEVRQKLSLEGIASVDGICRAVVNDEIVKVGSVIKGYEVLGICQQGMIVEYDGYWAWIPLGK